MGLLSKASNIDLSNKLAFSQFIRKHNIKTCAVFEITNGIYNIKNSIGFDSFSIAASESTIDFWDGICNKKNTVTSFSKSDNSVSSLLQFFSYTMNETIEFISIYRTDNKIFMFINEEIKDNMISDILYISDEILNSSNLTISSIEDGNIAFKYEISLDNAVDSYSVEAQLAIKNEISNRIINIYSKENYAIRISENKIRLCFISKDDFNGSAFSQHLKLNLCEVIDNNSNKINISFLGASNNINEIELFMKAE